MNNDKYYQEAEDLEAAFQDPQKNPDELYNLYDSFRQKYFKEIPEDEKQEIQALWSERFPPEPEYDPNDPVNKADRELAYRKENTCN